jgi:hypothetical protein
VPTPSRPTAGPRLTRRAALATLAAAVGGLAVGCTSPSDDRKGRDTAPEPPEPSIDPDVAVAAEALANQREVLALLEATTDRHPRLRPELAAAIDAHRAHEAMLSRAVPDDVPVSPSPSASQAPTTSTEPAPEGTASPGATSTPDVPGRRSRALAQVVAAERALATSTKRHAFRAQSGAFARLLGSMAAASAQYAVVLSSGKETS